MKPKGLLHFPQWVKPKSLLIGDISYRRKTEDSEWQKYLWTGSEWRMYDLVSAALKLKSELRHGLQKHTKLVRETGR